MIHGVAGCANLSKQFVTLETARLRLRQWRADDADDVIAFYSDPKISQYVGGPRSTDSAWRGMALMIGHWQLHGFGYWAVEEKQDEQFVGCIGLWKSPGWPELELGYWLVEEHHGKGFGHEAGRACIEFARHTLEADSLVSYIDKNNIPSIRLAESLGATYEKTIELDTHGPHGVYRHF